MPRMSRVVTQDAQAVKGGNPPYARLPRSEWGDFSSGGRRELSWGPNKRLSGFCQKEKAWEPRLAWRHCRLPSHKLFWALGLAPGKDRPGSGRGLLPPKGTVHKITCTVLVLPTEAGGGGESNPLPGYSPSASCVAKSTGCAKAAQCNVVKTGKKSDWELCRG